MFAQLYHLVIQFAIFSMFFFSYIAQPEKRARQKIADRTLIYNAASAILWMNDSPIRFPVFTGCHLKHLFEFPAKVTDIVKPGFPGYCRDTVLCCREQLCRSFQSVIHQIADGRGVNIFMKNAKHTAFAESHRFRDIIKRDLIRIIFVNVLQHNLKLCLRPHRRL